jgi:type IV pilus assembly protein PilQ
MKLKQLLGILLLTVVCTTMAAAAGTQLTQVSAKHVGDATLVSIQATGAFTHTEYRPSENLLLVDMAGVSASKLSGKTRLLNAPNVVGYRVLEYKASSGTTVARIELTMAKGTGVSVSDARNALMVKVTGTAAAEEAAQVLPAPKSDSTAASVKNVSVVRGKNGMEVEILASAPVTPQAMKLASPDRIVLDLPNTIPSGKREIAVNGSSIKAVRMARFQVAPPVTRIVVDLAANQDYELVPTGNKITLKLHEAKLAQVVAPTVSAAKAEPVATAAATAEPAVAAASAPPVQAETAQPKNELIVLAAPVVPKAEAKVDPAARAAYAASKFYAQPAQSDMAPASSAALASAQPVNFLIPQQAAPAAAASAPASTGKRYTGEPISVNLKDVDLKDFFRLIHEISGLNVVLDPGVAGNLTIVLDDVPWDQALDIVLANNNLDRQLDGNVLRIARVDTIRKEAEAKRAQLDAVALAVPKVTVTRFLSYAKSDDVVPTLKKFISARGEIIADKRTNSLIIEDIPSTIPRVDELLTKLDRKTPEVEIEARVVAATRDFARDIGMQVGFGWGNGPSAVGGASAIGTSPLNVAGGSPQYFTSGSGSSGSSIPLFSNLPAGTGVSPATSGLSFNNTSNAYRLDVILTMAESRGLLKILSRPRIVTQNNIQAVVRQGVKIPVVTSAQLGGPPTVTYVDAFLRLTVTPQITSESTIFLNVDVENTSPDFGHTISGNPTLLTQQATTQVLVTDGGTVVLGGVIRTTNSVNVQQVPLLGDIPLLGNLFKHRAVSTETQELIFFITPKIITT